MFFNFHIGELKYKRGVNMFKKIHLISFMLLIFFWNFEKVYATDRVVTSFIPSDVWYENIFLIADKIETDKMAHKNFTLQVGLPGGGSGLLYNFPDWYNDKYTPELLKEDLNGDALTDIIVVLVSASGSGLSNKEIHILNQVIDPYQRYEEVAVESINKAVKRLVILKKQGDNAIIEIGKKKYVVDKNKLGYEPLTFDPPGVGQQENYRVENGILYGSTVVFISPSGSIGSLDIEYFWDGKMYKAKSIIFKPYVPEKPAKQ
jgi:hypothetical protein